MLQTDSKSNTVRYDQPNLTKEWKDIPWKEIERKVYKLQKRIYKASSRGNVTTVRRLQKLLMMSWSARCIAVRRVTQDNQGKKTAGVDGIKSLTPKQRLNLVKQLNLGTKVSPTRRVWIPKHGTEEKRPLGIPTMKDRALQALVKLALEPEWEAKFEPNSYGFRPGRSCQDAIEAIFSAINKKAKYVLDADISKCFDRIDHEQLLRKINTYPTLRRQIRAWLKSGVMDGKKLFPTSEGTPQGGIISPLLANIALHGMESVIKDLGESFDMRRPTNPKYQMARQTKRDLIHLIRYADDFVILHEDLTAIQRCKEFISEWLKDMGLELKPSKTRITHTLVEVEKEKPGFNFLGFNIRQYKVGRHNSSKDTKGRILGYKTIIKPSKDSQKEHYKEIAKVIESFIGKTQSSLIGRLNPIILGWCNYYRTVSSSETFEKMNPKVYWKLRKWAKHRHNNKGEKWINQKYWKTFGDDKWVFATREGKNPLQLIRHSEIKRKKDYVKVKGEASPYNGDLIYWSTRMGNHPEMPTRLATLIKKQKGKCPHCQLMFKEGELLEIDHIIPKSQGGKDNKENRQLLHRHCHDKKTANDNSLGTKSDCNSVKPKPQSIIPENYQWVEDMLVVTCV